MNNVVIFQNGKGEQLGRLAEHVLSDFAVIHRVDRLHNFSRVDLSQIDLVISLGSDWSLTDPRIVQQVRLEGETLRDAQFVGVPVLGICFGAQLLAMINGGKVFKSSRFEVGITRVAGVKSLECEGQWMQWHYDSFSVPPGFDELARNDLSTQAFRKGRSFGVQFHPEADSSLVSQWISSGGEGELSALGIDPQSLLDDVKMTDHQIDVACLGLYMWFCNQVIGS